jgi:hypothetical protein
MGRGTEEAVTEKPFLERWAGRKAAARQEPPAPRPAPPAPDETAHAPIDVDAPRQSAPITEEELAALPPVETLGAGSDIKDFLRPGVPAALKNAALRKMWLMTPAIRDHKDVAVDYAWDWNTPGGVPGDGGRLDPEKVAQWVRQIAGLEEPAPRKTRSATPKADAAAAAEAAHGKPDAATAAGETTHAAKPGDRERAAAEPAVPPRPRHGGARPE